MLAEVVQSVLYSEFVDIFFSKWQTAVLMYLISACLLYRIWRFTVRPYLRLQEPREYPYWIPCVGHVLSFLQNSEALLTTASKHFAPDRSPFAISLGTSTVYVVTDAQDVGQVYNSTDALSFDDFLGDIMRGFGTSETAIRKILQIPRPGEAHGHNNKSVSQVAHDLQVRQTQGDELDRLGCYMTRLFQDYLTLNAMSMHCLTSGYVNPKAPVVVLSLKNWTADVMIQAGQTAYFGPALSSIDTGLPATLIKLDNLSWQIFYKYPKICRPELNKLCERILTALRQYLAMPTDQRPCHAWFTQSLEKAYRDEGLSDEDIATQMLFLYWGINTNTSKVAFWMIAYLLRNRQLVDTIRSEISVAYTSADSVNSDRIYRNCPKLSALWLEALRMSTASTTLRGIRRDIVVGGKLLRAGNTVMVSARQLHLQVQAFGGNAAEFNHERFEREPNLERSSAFRPFGGGSTMCPGRLLAKHATLNFVALLFHRFDVDLDGLQSHPKYIESKPSIGVMGGEGDLRIRVKPRSTS